MGIGLIWSVVSNFLPWGRLKTLVGNVLNPTGILILIAVNIGGFLLWQNHSLKGDVSDLKKDKQNLEVVRETLTESNRVVNLELETARDKQKAVQAIMSDLQTKVDSLNSLSKEVEKDVAKYRKSDASKCVPSAERLSIRKSLTDSINAASGVLSSGDQAGVPNPAPAPAQ